MKWLVLLGFVATIPAANWLIGNIGTVCVPDGPCLIPVGPGIMAPSGVLMIGLALVLRDAIHEFLGKAWVFAAITVGAALSGLVAPGALVLASVVAFTFSELADFAVYTPLREHGRALAVAASGVAGAVVDSILFLWIAFGWESVLNYAAGNAWGKVIMSLLAAGAIIVTRAALKEQKTDDNI